MSVRRFAIAVAVSTVFTAALASGAQAQGRPSTLAMSCAQAKALVTQSGAVVLTTGPYTFDRFVRDRSFCTPDENLEPTWAPTRDAAQCLVGHRCERTRDRVFDR